MNKNVVIFAPHIDDELIGCFRTLRTGTVKRVFYFYDLTDERRKEAIRCSEMFNFEPVFVENSVPIVDPDDTIYVTSMKDVHPHHKQVNRLAKKYPNKKVYYSIDMNDKYEVLSEKTSNDKKISLRDIYRSQANLLENEKYHLFESYSDDDSDKMIWVTFQRKGLHRYPQAATDELLSDVSYLGNEHRHLFKFKVSIEVNHTDREIEFHQFLNWLESLYDGDVLQLDNKSCEMIADELSFVIARKYNNRKLIIEVSEDGECGCTCEYQI